MGTAGKVWTGLGAVVEGAEMAETESRTGSVGGSLGGTQEEQV